MEATEESGPLETCPTCGAPVRVHGSDEGTHYYVSAVGADLLDRLAALPVEALGALSRLIASMEAPR